ncbi:hypothetical protein PV327_009147 [Microctonus hyperodae]|uniref:Uncharacterized protein n=1 Tax=Microctonus hyperodae TaxID=165561 RepID=A0AA39FTS8_MICHY|nr:hypothetical protein PV327_009147 [Microctonus hyperodae]
MKVRSYPGKAVLEDPELLLDPEATRGRAMELLYEASWRECGINWANSQPRIKTNVRLTEENNDNVCRRPFVDVIHQLENVLDRTASTTSTLSSSSSSSSSSSLSCIKNENRSNRSSSDITSDSDNSGINDNDKNEHCEKMIHGNSSGGFLIPRPRLIVPVHTYARKRRTGATTLNKRRQNREGI